MFNFFKRSTKHQKDSVREFPEMIWLDQTMPQCWNGETLVCHIFVKYYSHGTLWETYLFNNIADAHNKYEQIYRRCTFNRDTDRIEIVNESEAVPFFVDSPATFEDSNANFLNERCDF